MTTSSDPIASVALAIPAYNEADGIAGFLRELDSALAAEVAEHTFVVVDDTSKDNTIEVVKALDSELSGTVIVDPNTVNLGHGPTVLKAYRLAIGTGAEWVLQVDGDGQFEGEDIARLFAEARAGNDIVTGARMTRFDPWYRKVVTRTLPLALNVAFGVKRGDVNCPFRLYRSPVLEKILDEVPDDSLTPHVLMTVLEDRSGAPHVEIAVKHRPRRGDSEVGTTWREGKNLGKDLVIPKKLLMFLGKAGGQLAQFRGSLR